MKRKIVFPEFGSRARVEGATLIVARAAGKDESAGGHGGSAKILRAGLKNAARLQLRVFPEGNFPRDPARVEVEAGQRTPGRRASGIPLGVEQPLVAHVGPLRLGRRRGAGRSRAPLRQQKGGGMPLRPFFRIARNPESSKRSPKSSSDGAMPPPCRSAPWHAAQFIAKTAAPGVAAGEELAEEETARL